MKTKPSSGKRNITILIIVILLLLAASIILALSGKDSQAALKPTTAEEIQSDLPPEDTSDSIDETEDPVASMIADLEEVTVVDAYLNDDLHLIQVMSNGTEIDTGYAGPKDNGSDSANTYTVTFADYNGAVLKTETVRHGGNATPPANPSRQGFVFTGWKGSYTNVTADQTVIAEFVSDDPSVARYTVYFVDHDGSILKSELVEKGAAATAPEVSRAGYVFLRWDKAYDNVTSNLLVNAVYEEIPGNDPEIVAGAVTAAAGTTVDVAVSLRNNPGMVGMTLKLDYDESAMTLTAVTQGEALSEMTFTTPKALASGCQFPWDAEEVLPENATNGEILILTFAVSEKAAPGSYPVAFTYDHGAIIDNDLNPVNVVLKSGTVTVQ